MKCPGQDMQYWRDDAIFDVDCPECGATVEFYKDDTTRKCHSCNHRFVNPKMDFGCASYCQFAEQCLGTLPEDFVGSREDLLKDKVAVEVKRHYHTDFKSIKKASDVARFAENLGKAEGGNLGVLLCASYLHGLEQEVCDRILSKVGAAGPLAETIHHILAGEDHDNKENMLSCQIISDSLSLYNFQEQLKASTATSANRENTAKSLLTGTAKTILDDLKV